MPRNTKGKDDEGVYSAICNHWIEYMLPPTTRYLVENTLYESNSTVWLRLCRLQEKGLIRIVKGKAIPTGMSIKIDLGELA